MISMRRNYQRTADRSRSGVSRDTGGIYDGTVGWEDGEAHFDIDPNADTGTTLVKVTLFKGRNPDTEPAKKDNRAKGQRVLCRIGSPLNFIPPDGSQVVVAMPAGRMLDPGAGVIITTITANPSTQFGGTKSKMDFGPDYDLVIKARSITFTDYEDRYFTLGPLYGIKMGDAGANGCQLKNAEWKFYTAAGSPATATTTFMLSKANGIALLHDDGKKTAMSMKGGVWQGIGDSFKGTFGAGYLGIAAAPTPAQGVAYSAAGPVNLFSTSWFVSP